MVLDTVVYSLCWLLGKAHPVITISNPLLWTGIIVIAPRYLREMNKIERLGSLVIGNTTANHRWKLLAN